MVMDDSAEVKSAMSQVHTHPTDERDQAQTPDRSKALEQAKLEISQVHTHPTNERDQAQIPDSSKVRSRAHYSAMKKRRKALGKKAAELAVLCGVKLCMVCYGPNGGAPEIWPENKSDVQEILTRFQQLNKVERDKKRFTLSDFPESKRRRKEEDLSHMHQKTPRFEHHTWCPELEEYSEKQLRLLAENLDEKLHTLNTKIDMLVSKKQTKEEEMANFPQHPNNGEDNLIASDSNSDLISTADQNKSSPLIALPTSSGYWYYTADIKCPQYLVPVGPVLPTIAENPRYSDPSSSSAESEDAKLGDSGADKQGHSGGVKPIEDNN